MVYLAAAAGAVLAPDDPADVDADVDVDVDVELDGLLPDLLSEPQPTSAKMSVMETVAAVKYFIYPISRKLGPVRAPATPERE